MLKKLLVIAVVGFVLYYLLTSPDGAADVIRGAFDAIIEAFGQIGVFVTSLIE